MTEDEPNEPPPHHDTRTQLIVDVVVLQLKLALGGLRDVLLIPVSIAAASLTWDTVPAAKRCSHHAALRQIGGWTFAGVTTHGGAGTWRMKPSLNGLTA